MSYTTEQRVSGQVNELFLKNGRSMKKYDTNDIYGQHNQPSERPKRRN